MLDPGEREVYAEAMRPPPGYRFDEGIGATYSLDLTTLLTIPLYLALYAAEESSEELLEDGIALLEALRGTASRLDVYCQRGRIHAPHVPRTLFSLLEPIVIEAAAPRGGAFHPKFWLLRFKPTRPNKPPILRLAILTRNLTSDRCWDLALVLEGTAADVEQPGNRDIARLIAALPEMAGHTPPSHRVERATRLAGEVARCEWELPPGFHDVRFHAIGLDGARPWRPGSKQQLIVISPFVTGPALDRLTPPRKTMPALISRPEELAALSDADRGRFEHVYVLDEAAEQEDGDDVPEYREAGTPLRGLHAKAYLFRKGYDTHVVMGSANATTAALVAGRNVEILAELIGRKSRIGNPLDQLTDEGFGRILTPYVHDASLAPDEAIELAQQQLDAARDALAGAGLRLRCALQDAGWLLQAVPGAPLELPGIAQVKVWPVTLKEERAEDGRALTRGQPLDFAVGDVAYLSAFLGFELTAASAPESIRFVLALPVDGLPVDERNASILRSVIRNREGFIRYLLLLLSDAGEELGGQGLFRFSESTADGRSGLEDVPLLEEMTRAYCRDVPRLRAVRRLIEELGAAEQRSDVVPDEFWAVWSAFEQALESRE